MTTPPSGQWPPQQPPGFPPGPPQWGPPPQWSQQPPQNGSNRAKWILGALALIVVVVITVAATLLITRDDSGGSASTPPGPSVDASDVASADDDGPVGIITEDPTCESWTVISTAYAHASSNGWDQRDPSIPASNWNSDQRRQYEAVGAAVRQATHSTVTLAFDTPHRVMRVLYEQFISYGRAYAERIPEYTESDDHLALVSIGISATLNAVCDSIVFGAATARSPLVPEASSPRNLEQNLNPAEPERFLLTPNPVCTQWLEAAKRYGDDTAAWRSVDPNLSSAELTLEQRAINNAAMPIMEEFASEIQLLGRESASADWADIAILSAQYRRGYVSALPTYEPADNDLQVAAGSAVGAISEACRSVGG